MNTSSFGIITGDIHGNIKVYNLNSKLIPTLTRAYIHAHHGHILTIKCCPLNSEE